MTPNIIISSTFDEASHAKKKNFGKIKKSHLTHRLGSVLSQDRLYQMMSQLWDRLIVTPLRRGTDRSDKRGNCEEISEGRYVFISKFSHEAFILSKKVPSLKPWFDPYCTISPTPSPIAQHSMCNYYVHLCGISVQFKLQTSHLKSLY